jgi:hypothetical protein
MEELPQELRDAISVVLKHGLAVCDTTIQTWLAKTADEYEVDSMYHQVETWYGTDIELAIQKFCKLVKLP